MWPTCASTERPDCCHSVTLERTMPGPPKSIVKNIVQVFESLGATADGFPRTATVNESSGAAAAADLPETDLGNRHCVVVTATPKATHTSLT